MFMMLINKDIHWFFRCTYCGQWYTSKYRIQKKQCVFCNKTFDFKSSRKLSCKCTESEAVLLIQKLKERDFKDDLKKVVISFMEV